MVAYFTGFAVTQVTGPDARECLSLPFGKIDPNRICSEVGIAPVLCRQALAHVPGLDGAVDRTRGDHFNRWRRLLRRLTATFIHPSAWKRFSRTFAKNVSRDLVQMGGGPRAGRWR